MGSDYPKSKGGAETPGTFADKQQALGLTEQIMKTYDKSVPEAAPSASLPVHLRKLSHHAI